jgi:hypothetical protein
MLDVHQMRTAFHRSLRASSIGFAALTLMASCTSSSGNDAGVMQATCTSPGGPTTGAPDMHCTMMQVVNPAACDGGTSGDDGGGGQGCPYGDTMDGQTGNDDDCKYHVTWSSTPICNGSAPAIFTVVATNLKSDLTSGAPLTGAGTIAEVFTTTPMNAGSDAGYCDVNGAHLDPSNRSSPMTENPPGTYTGPIYFDKSGLWTVRFHFKENCNDTPDSPHGHAAFHVMVP